MCRSLSLSPSPHLKSRVCKLPRIIGMQMIELISKTKIMAVNTFDLACWTALAPLVRKWRSSHIESASEDVRIKRKAMLLCQELASQYDELTVPAW